MSDAVTALNGAQYDGLVRVEEAPLQGMITVRGTLEARAVKSAVKAAAGTDVPAAGLVSAKGTGAVCWMSPDEVLVLCPYDEVDERLSKLQSALSKAHALAVDVSDARALFRVTGPDARDVLAKLCPVDLAPDAFSAGMMRRTRLAQVAAAFWMDDDQSFHVVCFRSVADYVFELLKGAATPAGKVGYFQSGA